MFKKWFLLLLLMATWQFAKATNPSDADTLWSRFDYPCSPTFSPDSKYVLLSGGNFVKVLDVKTGVETRRFTGKFFQNANWVVFSDDGKRILSASGNGGRMIVWDYITQDTIKMIDSLYYFNIVNDNTLLAAKPKHINYADGTTDSTIIMLIDLTSGKTTKQTTILGSISNIALSKQRDKFAITTGSRSLPILAGNQNKELELWDVNSLSKICQLGSHLTIIQMIAFSPNGQYLISSSLDIKKIWNVQTKQLYKTLDSVNQCWGYAWFSLGGRFIITSTCLDNGSTSILDFNNLNLIYKYFSPYIAGAFAISNDSQYIAMGGSTVYMMYARWSPNGIISPPDQQNQLYLYPNPAGSIINVPLNSNYRFKNLSIYNISGILSKTTKIVNQTSNNITEDISSLAIGHYYILVEYAEKTITFNFEKIR